MTDDKFEIVKTTDASFETDVMIRSQLGLVIVDFWAEWCAPCRMLTPSLEKLAGEYHERLTLVKANTDENQDASQRFAVTGIPAVFAVLDEKTIDSFQGVLPEDALRSWIEKCLGKEALFRAKQLVMTDADAAEKRIREIIDETSSDEAKVALVELLHTQDRDEECREAIAELAKRGFLGPECERIQSELDLRQHAVKDIGAIRARVEANRKDFVAQYELAEALAAKREFEEAFEICLTLVQDDRQKTGEHARQLMINAFRVLGDDAELTRDYRRKLSMVLY